MAQLVVSEPVDDLRRHWGSGGTAVYHPAADSQRGTGDRDCAERAKQATGPS